MAGQFEKDIRQALNIPVWNPNQRYDGKHYFDEMKKKKLDDVFDLPEFGGPSIPAKEEVRQVDIQVATANSGVETPVVDTQDAQLLHAQRVHHADLLPFSHLSLEANDPFSGGNTTDDDIFNLPSPTTIARQIAQSRHRTAPEPACHSATEDLHFDFSMDLPDLGPTVAKPPDADGGEVHLDLRLVNIPSVKQAASLKMLAHGDDEASKRHSVGPGIVTSVQKNPHKSKRLSANLQPNDKVPTSAPLLQQSSGSSSSTKRRSHSAKKERNGSSLIASSDFVSPSKQRRSSSKKLMQSETRKSSRKSGSTITIEKKRSKGTKTPQAADAGMRDSQLIFGDLEETLASAGAACASAASAGSVLESLEVAEPLVSQAVKAVSPRCQRRLQGT
eukprot:CAMPEP_0177629092 /NCGR_PEP_ID=MMETSP0447-20121125/484_1 /TAXON_ID=0 /ORGANISM="Stygamoeba regulata, Strain BSH-02190019" /LENGTH=388 /DNA_ID=CAMNT_0019130391 /DNA_START=292 /DNA_END=1458 /DNA_ORIENTATION=-